MGEEMTLRQFGTPSELLTKLRADLRLSFPRFVNIFMLISKVLVLKTINYIINKTKLYVCGAE